MFKTPSFQFLRAHLGARALFLAFCQLLLLVLLAVPNWARAQTDTVVFETLTPSTTGGTVPAGGVWVAGFTFKVKVSPIYEDAIAKVELRVGATVLASRNFIVRWDPDHTIPVNLSQSGSITGNLGAGVHQMYLRAITAYGEVSDSNPVTVTVMGPSLNAAAFVSQNVPSTMVAGAPSSVTVRMRNTGTTTWTAAEAYRLGSVDGNIWNAGRVELPGSVTPGQEGVFTIPVNAPAAPGNYNMRWQMLRELVEWFGATTDNVVVAVVAKSTTTLAASTNTPLAGSAITLTASVSGSGPTGNVIFRDGATVLATVPVSNGVASYNSPALTVGTHAITASYSGNVNNSASVSPTVNVTWAKAASTTTLAASSSTPALGNAVMFTASVAGSNPTGSITFKEGAVVLATVPLTGGTANFNTSSLVAGSHSLIASYGGDGTNAASTSAARVVTVVSKPVSKFDGAMSKTKYVVLSGDVNGDGQNDVLLKAVPDVMMIPVDDDLQVPIPLPTPSPTFALISSSYGTYTLVVNPAAAMLSSAAWVAGTQQIAFSGATATMADSVTITATTNEQASFVVSMAGDTGLLQITQTTPPATNTTGQPSSSAPIAVTIAPPHLGNPDAGTLPGELSVDKGGAATYSIDLVVPPGTAGVQPKLALEYRGSAGNSILGLGWSLSGMSSIARCGKTMAQDGVNNRISFTTSDRLCLDGARLVRVNGANVGSDPAAQDAAYWADGAEFRTEIETFSRITTQNTNGQRSFKIETKDGRILTFGATASSFVQARVGPVNSGTWAPQPVAKSGAQSWAVDRITDRMGNYVSFAYTQDMTTGEHLPDTIRYGGVGMPAHAAVKFIAEQRPDAWKRFIDESRNDMRKRIAGIRTFVGTNLDGDPETSGSLVRNYALKYERSPTSGRSLLASVEASARNPQTNVIETLPKTVFDWGKPDPNKTAGFENKGAWPGAPILTVWRKRQGGTNLAANHADFFSFADMNGDGFSDTLEKRVAVPSFEADASIDGRRYADQNPILDGTMRSTYRFFLNNGSGFSQYSYGINGGAAFAVLEVSDFDGDGAQDLLVGTAQGAKICLSPLAGGRIPALGSTITFTCDPSRPAVGSNHENELPTAIDLAGDGRAMHYSSVPSSGPVMLCNYFACAPAKSIPATLSGKGRDNTMPDRYPYITTSFLQMIDVAGIGKSYDVRATKPRFQINLTDGSETIRVNMWTNLQPRLLVTGFPLDGVTPIPSTGQFYDYVYPTYARPTCESNTCAPYFFDRPRGGDISIDLNGSGYQGMVYGYFDMSRDPMWSQGLNTTDTTVCLSTGRAFDCSVRKKYSGTNYKGIRSISSFVGDGHPTILADDIVRRPVGWPAGSGPAVMCTLMGDDTTNGAGVDDDNMHCKPWPGISLPQTVDPRAVVDQMYFMDLLGTGRKQIVVYRTGKFDTAGNWTEDGRWEVYAPIDVALPGQALDRIVQVTNGLGAVTSVEYVDGLPTGVVNQTGNSGLVYPQRTVSLPGKVVHKLRSSNGVSDPKVFTYRYSDMGNDVGGRGSLGFKAVMMTDEQTGIVTTTRYGQAWPHTGAVVGMVVARANGVILSDTVSVPKQKELIHSSGVRTVFPYIESSVVKKRDLDNSDLGVTTKTYHYEDGWGNVTKNAVDTRMVGSSEAFVVSTDTVYRNDSASWVLGRPTSSKLTKADPTSGTVVRTTTFDYDAKGMLKSSTVEPGSPLHEILTTIDRTGNPFGLQWKKTESWTDPLAGRKERATTTTYDPHGRYSATVKNPLGHTESYTHDSGSGVRTKLTDANNLVSTWMVNGFGQIEREIRVDGTEIRVYQKQCIGDCPPGATFIQVSERQNKGARIDVPNVVYHDHVGHVVRSQVWGLDGRAIVTDNRFDRRTGNLMESDHPRYLVDIAYPALRKDYDELNRVTMEHAWDDSGVQRTMSTEYHGVTKTITNALKHKRIETRNALGQLIFVTDPKLGKTQFTYEPFGSLKKTIDPNGNVIEVTTDILGRRTDLRDPDLGHIHYDVDPVGQVYAQTNPEQRLRGQRTLTKFDLMGRIVSREAGDLRSYWIYDTASTGIGQLAESYTGTAALKDYRLIHTYDNLGRPSVATTVLTDASYVARIAYDAWGRVISQTYQRGTDTAKVFDLRYGNTGRQTRIERNGTVLWRLDELDASQRIKKLTLGNGLTQSSSYYPHSGRLSNSVLAANDSSLRLSESYQYDSIGSVAKRAQYWDTNGFQEDFTYDSLGRVDTSSVLGQTPQTFTYDAVGNLLTKTGVGTGAYDYGTQGVGATLPHAVKTIPGIGSFTYDGNGNLTAGAGRTIKWTSFDMPDMISSATASSIFIYGPELQRVRQDRGDGSQIIYAGEQEVEKTAGNITVKTYWPGGIGVEIDRPGSATELLWVHKDRLGSPIGVSGRDGILREKLAYDAWGKRRTLDGNAIGGTTVPNNLDGKLDNKGFTGHEMLDQLDLVHMNGRVYDPFVARVMSPDPIIDYPEDGQAYNRYSYVKNNPTNITDPTGFIGKCAENGRGSDNPCNEPRGDEADGTHKLTKPKAEAGTDKSAMPEESKGKGNSPSPGPSANSEQGILAKVSDFLSGANRETKCDSVGCIHQGTMEATPVRSNTGDPVQDFLNDRNSEVATTVANAGMKVANWWKNATLLGIGGMAEGGAIAAAEAGSIRGVNAVRGTMNCVNCVVATDATLAGRSASALPGGPYRISVLEKLFGGRFSAPGQISNISDALSKAGPGARGIVFGSRGSEVGHVFNVANQNGVVRYLDGQTGKAAVLDGYKNFQLLRTN